MASRVKEDSRKHWISHTLERSSSRIRLQRRLVAIAGLATVLLASACSGSATSDSLDSTTTTSTPSTSTSLPSSEPTIQRMVRALPGTSWDPDQPIRNGDFQRFDSLRHTEVGQTIEVTEPFTLHRISVWFASPSIALPGFRETYYDGIDWSLVEQFVDNPSSVDDIKISLSIVLYRSPDPAAFPTVQRRTSGFGPVPVRTRDVIPISKLEVVSDQILTGTIRGGSGSSELDLTTPVFMEPGRWVVALRIDRGTSEVDIIDLPLIGWESGKPPDVVIPKGNPCEYTPADDPSPGFGFYWRDSDSGDSNFIPAFAKVQACLMTGRYDNPLGTGDIGLDLWGFPAE